MEYMVHMFLKNVILVFIIRTLSLCDQFCLDERNERRIFWGLFLVSVDPFCVFLLCTYVL